MSIKVQWQPIETAPKDGSEIIVGEAGTLNIELVRWNDCGWVFDAAA